jgi:ribosomal protein S18 acetylase RimI-like enzyme
MHIRPADENDLPSLIHLKSSRDEGYYRGAMKEMSRGEAVVMVAENEGLVVGQVILRYYGSLPHHDYPDILDLRVSEQYRGQGIGSELIAVCEHLASVRGFNKIGISVNPTMNAGARRLYQRLGFQPSSNAPYLDGEVNGQENWVIDMTKKITPVSQ